LSVISFVFWDELHVALLENNTDIITFLTQRVKDKKGDFELESLYFCGS